MSEGLAGPYRHISAASGQGISRLAPALLLSAIAHVVVAQCLPHAVRAYDGTPPSNVLLTVSLQPAAPTTHSKVNRLAIPVPLHRAAVPDFVIPEAVNLIAVDQH